NRGVGKMKDVVEPVAVRVADVVGEWVTDEDPVPLQIGLAAQPLIDAYYKLPRELFFDAELRIKVHQLAGIRVCERPSRLSEISSDYIGKDEARAMQSLKVVSCEG